MAATHVGIVYGNVDRRIRRVIIPHDQLSVTVAPDETLVRMPIAAYRLERDLAKSLGLP